MDSEEPAVLNNEVVLEQLSATGFTVGGWFLFSGVLEMDAEVETATPNIPSGINKVVYGHSNFLALSGG